MARVIDVQTIIEEIQSSLDIPSYSEHDMGFDDGLKYVLDLIEKAPTLTPLTEPLTLEQLRKMDGEPVWVKCLKPNKYIDPPIRWRILEKSITGTFGVWDGECGLIERDYGTDWISYRHPPEGDEDT